MVLQYWLKQLFDLSAVMERIIPRYVSHDMSKEDKTKAPIHSWKEMTETRCIPACCSTWGLRSVMHLAGIGHVVSSGLSKLLGTMPAGHRTGPKLSLLP